MSTICNCTIPTELADVGLGSFENMGLIRRLFFQRKYASTVLNGLDLDGTPADDPTTLASWTPFFSAVDSTKIIKSPIFEEVTVTPGGAVNYERANQIPLKIAEAPITVEMKGVAIDKDTQNALRALQCETENAEKLSAFVVNECGYIWGQGDGTTIFRGFDIEYLNVEAAISEMAFDSPQKFNVTMVLKATAMVDRVSYVPSDFNALDI